MIKKIAGILMIVLGLILENIGLFNIATSGGQLKTIDRQLQQDLFDSYSREHEQSLILGGGLIAIGLLILIIGMVLMSTHKPDLKNSKTN